MSMNEQLIIFSWGSLFLTVH